MSFWLEKFAARPQRAILLLSLVLLLAGNWILPLTDRDETRFAEASREMLQRSDFVVPWFNGAWRFDKPVLIYWCQSASYRVFGENPFAARLPSALFTAATALLLVRWSRKFADAKTAFMAGAMFVAGLHVAIIGRVATADMAMVFFTTLAVWSGWELTRPEQPHRKSWWWIFYVALALGFLAKGPVAWLPFGGLVLARLWRKDSFHLPLLFLADRAGADAPKLLDALIAVKAPAKRQGLVIQRTAQALLHDTNFQITAPQVNKAIADLQKGVDVAGAIETRLQAAMTQQLGLNNLLAAGVKPTDHGVEMVQTKLKNFFALGANSQAVDQAMFKKLLASVLEDRFQDFRFTLAPTAKQLSGLKPEQQKLWKASQTMNHVRFDAKGQKAFDGRVKYAAQIGKALVARFTEAWGPLEQVRAAQEKRLNTLRKGDKNDPARKDIQIKVALDTRKLEALTWANDLAGLTPETTTPLQFIRFADRRLTRMQPAIGGDAFEALVAALKIDDLSFTEVTTNDGPDLDTIFRLGSANCLRGWPHDPILLAYGIDANKRMIVTKNQAGEERRAMMRLVDRQDPGHVGQQMLVLERTYPDAAPEEEKQRIIEHTLRRATEMGIAAAFPTEYYWNASATGRRLMDMNRVIEDLNRRYHTTSEEKVAEVKNRGGNLGQEYIDSAPTRGAAGAGIAEVRRYPGNRDHVYQNKFMILSPKKD